LHGECDSNATKTRTVDVFDANATGIGNIEDKNSIVLYPNPATGSVSIESSALSFTGVDVFNILGQKVKAAATVSASKIILNTSSLASGFYSVRILTDKGFIVRKFEVRR
jgi:hypothetical protein